MLLEAIANGGITFGRLLMVVGVVGIIVGVMSTTDLPSKLGREISDLASVALILTLAISAILSPERADDTIKKMAEATNSSQPAKLQRHAVFSLIVPPSRR